MTASPHANEYKVYQIQKKERSLKTRALDKSSFLDNEFQLTDRIKERASKSEGEYGFQWYMKNFMREPSVKEILFSVKTFIDRETKKKLNGKVSNKVIQQIWFENEQLFDEIIKLSGIDGPGEHLLLDD